MPPDSKIAASFRDPSGFLFKREGALYRQVNKQYERDYTRLMQSGLYDDLVSDGLLIPHEETAVPAAEPDIAYKIIRPELVPFVSYPYEWCFSQLKDAALTTLTIQKRALDRGLWLKDASAYNIQFYRGRPVLIDTLSFEAVREGEPWTAYRQFCQHFLAPLALMAYCDVRLSQLLRVYIDGVPLDLASSLLPFRTRLKFSLLMHLHLHASAQKKYAGTQVSQNQRPRRKMSRNALVGVIDSLETAVRGLKWEPVGTEWADYYSDTNYSRTGDEHKAAIITGFLERAAPQSVWDLGANTGRFSRLASRREIPTAAFDIDPGAVERNYQKVRANGEVNLLPLIMDLTNPSSDLGWSHQERSSLIGRGPADLVMALALVHHLAIANNVPLDQVASFFSACGEWLIIEFVPKSDSQVQRLLATREDIFPGYTREGFEESFGRTFTIVAAEAIQDSERILYLMQRR